MESVRSSQKATETNNNRLENGKGAEGPKKNLPRVESLPTDYGRHMAVLYENPMARKFQFPAAEGEFLDVTELMAECQIFASVPTAYLKLVSDWTARRLANIERLAYTSASPAEESSRATHIKWHRQHLSAYEKALAELRDSPPAYFKPSGRKDEANLQFLPTNLHCQRLIVQQAGEAMKMFDFFTSGCYAAIPLGFRNHSGLLTGQKRLKELTTAANTGPRQLAQLQLDICQLEGFKHQLEELRANVRSLVIIKTELNPTPGQVDCGALAGKMTRRMQQLMAGFRDVCDRLDLMPVVNDLYGLYVDRRLSLCASHPATEMNGHSSSADVKTERSSKELDDSTKRVEEIFPLDSINSDVDARVMVFSTKQEMFSENFTEKAKETSDLAHWLDDLTAAGLQVVSGLDKLQQSLSDACHYLWLKSFPQTTAIDLFYSVQYRQTVTTCQAVTAIASGLAHRLWTHEPATVGSDWIVPGMKAGLLICFNSYLSCHGSEKGMIEDVQATLVGLASQVRVRLVPGFSVTSASGIVSLSGWPSDLLLNIAVPSDVYENLPEDLKLGATLKVVPLLFNVGINEDARWAYSFGDPTIQTEINLSSFASLKSYAELACEEMHKAGSMGDRNRRLVTQLLGELEVEVATMEKQYKNVDLLHHVSRICRLLKGISFLTCKSGKDRTSMAVTLEEAFVLQQLGLPEVELQSTLDKLRRDGCRIENLRKNAGVERYAFNKPQLIFLPELYRPPKNCYATGQT